MNIIYLTFSGQKADLARIVLNIFMMKKMIEVIKIVFDEIKKDIDVYLAIQRYSRVARKDRNSLENQ